MSELMVTEQAESLEPTRTIEVITEEIQFYKRQAGGALIEIGRRLNEAKEQLPHGEWLPWLQEKAGFSERSAQTYMKIARELEKSAEIADLGVSKALALLDLPDSERSDFVSEKHMVNGEEKAVVDMTTAELKQAIQERDEARVLAQNLQEDLEEKQKGFEADMEVIGAKLAAAEQDKAKMAEDVNFLNERVKGLSDEVAEREKELQELRSRPVDVAVQEADPAELERAREEGAAAAREAGEQELQKAQDALEKAKAKEKEARDKLKELKEQMAQAEERAKRAQEDAERARKEAQVAGNKDLAAFTVLFEQTQGGVNSMVGLLRKMEQDGRGEDAAKLRRALEALAGQISKAAKEGER